MRTEDFNREEFQKKLLKLEKLKKEEVCEFSDNPRWGVWTSVQGEGEDQRTIYWIKPGIEEKVVAEMPNLFTEVTGFQSGVIKAEDYVENDK